MLNFSILQSYQNDSIPKVEDLEPVSDSTMFNDFYHKMEDQLKKYIPDIKKVMKDNFKKITNSTLKNDKAMTTTFKKSYQFLPLPIRLMVDQDDFVKFCMRNKHLIMEVK